MKICPVAAELFHADRWRERHSGANSRLSQILQTCLKMLKEHFGTGG